MYSVNISWLLSRFNFGDSSKTVPILNLLLSISQSLAGQNYACLLYDRLHQIYYDLFPDVLPEDERCCEAHLRLTGWEKLIYK